jgi:hypothetical protein
VPHRWIFDEKGFRDGEKASKNHIRQVVYILVDSPVGLFRVIST